MVRVVPEFRRRGAGSSLYAAVSAHARRLGKDTLWGRVEDGDEVTLRLVARWGVQEVGRECEVILRLADIPGTPPEPPAGVTIVSLAERPELARAAHAVELEAVPDIPTLAQFEGRSFERSMAANIEGPGALTAACFVALAGEEVVGYAGLSARGAERGSAEHLLTGVRRAWRGRGVATALKQAQIACARRAGFERLVTSNDEGNLAMRGINARLGYLPLKVLIQVQRPLARSTGR